MRGRRRASEKTRAEVAKRRKFEARVKTSLALRHGQLEQDKKRKALRQKAWEKRKRNRRTYSSRTQL